MNKYTIKDFNKEYPDDEACLKEIFEQRYGSLSVCPNCEKTTKFHKVSNRKCYACQYCGFQLHPLADTIFNKSSTPLKLWFFAIFLMSYSKNGVSAKELQRLLGVTYKTAWRMAKEIRRLMQQDDDTLSGIVEVDEAYIGGKRKGTVGRGAKGKTPVMGMVQRQGKAKAKVVEDVTRYTATKMIKQNIALGTDLMTDDYTIYHKISKEGFNHKVINHSKGKYVDGAIHTNTIEGFWSQLKRSIHGTYHSVSKQHLQKYLDECVWKYNNRKNPTPFFPLLLARVEKLS